MLMSVTGHPEDGIREIVEAVAAVIAGLDGDLIEQLVFLAAEDRRSEFDQLVASMAGLWNAVRRLVG